MMHAASSSDAWAARLRGFFPELLGRDAATAPFAARGALLFHGSTLRGIDDAWSDLDVWWLLDDADLAALDAGSPTRFFEFELGGKPGHVNAESAQAFADRLARCELKLTAELRVAHVLRDEAGGAAGLQAEARRPMREDVRRALFFHHYVEMRGEHRGVDTPMERGHALPVLLAVAKTLAHALRAALVLHGEPYPYDKWLHADAVRTPTGRRLAPHAEHLLDLLAAEGLRPVGSQKSHPVQQELRAIRACLVDAARQTGIDEPWLDRWWLHIPQARAAPARVRW